MPRKMNIGIGYEQVTWWRKLAGKVATVFCILFFISAGDAIISQTRQPLNLIEIIPGASENFNFTLKDKVESLDELSYQNSSEILRTTLESVHKGFWLGAYMCRGVLSVNHSAAPGDYSINIFLKKKKTLMYEFKVRIYQDADDYRRHAKSFIFRHAGISPWLTMVICPFFALTAGVGIFYLSRRRTYLQALSGQSEIYKASRKDDGYYEISFELGKSHGIAVGMRVDVYNDDNIAIGQAEVTEVSEKDSTAKIAAEYVRPGYMVSKS